MANLPYFLSPLLTHLLICTSFPPSHWKIEARKALFKKRNLYLRAEEKGLDLALQATLLRKTEKEHAKLMVMIDEKIEREARLVALLEQHLARLEADLNGKLSMGLSNPHAAIFADIPDVEPTSETGVIGSSGSATNGGVPGGRSRSSPKHRQTLQDEPIDPNEPVYCYCRQVSHGDMIACDNPTVLSLFELFSPFGIPRLTHLSFFHHLF